MRLFIAEKPDLAKVIAAALGNPVSKSGYLESGNNIITWAYGHLLELVPPDVHNPDYAKWNTEDLPLKLRPHKYRPIERTATQLEVVESLIARADEIVHAGDPDAEGQLLVDEILIYTNCNKPVKRFLLNDLDVNKAKKQLGKIRDNSEFYGLSQRALARSVGDQLYGFNMTRAYTLAARNKGMAGVLSVGRVQTPVLGLIVNRYLANKSHDAAFFYSVRADIQINGQVVTSRLNVPDSAPVDEKKRIIDKEYATGIINACKSKPVNIHSAETKEKKTSAPLPFALLDLQVKMSQDHDMSPEATLEVTQSLRENHKAITYNRSDCRYLSTEQFEEAPETLAAIREALNLAPGSLAEIDPNRKSRAFNDNNITAHTAIIPTTTRVDISRMSQDELKVYTAIATQYLIQFMPEKTYLATAVTFSCENYTFVSNATKTTGPGWTALVSDTASDEEENESESSDSSYDVLSALSSESTGTCQDVIIKDEKTKPLPLYTMAALLEDLKRVAKYVKDPRIKELLLSRDKDNKTENGGIGTPATRGRMLAVLEERGFYTITKKKIIPTELGISFIKTLPAIATEPDMTALWHEQQLMIESGEMTCDEFLNVLEDFIGDQIKNVNVDTITGGLIQEKQTTQFERLDVACPNCGKEIVVSPKVYGCIGCDFKIWGIVAEKQLTKAQVETIISKGKSGEIKNFISNKSGSPKAFSAILELEDKATGQLKMSFPPKTAKKPAAKKIKLRGF